MEMRVSRFALAVLLLGLCGVAALAIAGPGSQWGLWSFRTGFAIMRWAAWAGLGVAALSLIACFVVTSGPPQRGLALAGIAVLCGVLTFAVPASMREMARSVPRIHDITTDMQNPPRFVRIIKLREETQARNTIIYGGEKIAAEQRKAYPDIAPLLVSVPPRAAFDAALAVAVDFGWDIVSSAPGHGRIEATATTRWFGFKDDVVIRVSTAGKITRVDIRSVSRIGRNDAGANAARIRLFLERLNKNLVKGQT